jgi:hypothetical protein
VKRGSVWFGSVLILVGALLLSDRFNLFAFRWPEVLWAGVAVLAGVMLVRHFKGGEGAVFWWTVLLLFAGYKLLRGFGIWYPPESIGLPALLVMAGIGFFVMFLAVPRNWHLLIPALALGGFGTIMLLSELGLMAEVDARAFVKNYWPFALIAFGAALLLNWRGRAGKT